MVISEAGQSSSFGAAARLMQRLPSYISDIRRHPRWAAILLLGRFMPARDVAQWAARCRFRDCRHGAEPGCAVREAVAPERLRNFQKLQREARRDHLTALEKREQVAQWKARGRQADIRMRAKRSG